MTTSLTEKYNYADGHLYFKDGEQLNETADSFGHLQVWDGDKLRLLHRMIWEYHYGDLPPLIDHKDRNPANNRIENLRPLSHSFNTVNSDTLWGKVPFRGVSIHKESGKYRARIRKDGHLKSLGLFTTPEAAAEAYKTARETLFKGAYVDANQLELPYAD